MPRIGIDLILMDSEIRYCLAEKIRLGAWEGAVNTRSSAGVDQFNRAIGEYNSRCGSFRYRQSTMNSIRPEVEARRSELVRQGLAHAAHFR